MSFTTTGYTETTKTSLTEDTAANSGSGGDDMDVWQMDRQTQLTRLFETVPSFSNKSSYPTPTGAVSTSGYPEAPFGAEFGMGTLVRGKAQESDGSELAGEVSFTHLPTDSTLLSDGVSGLFKLFAAPSTGVTQGADSDLVFVPSNMGVTFEPSFAGLAYEDSDLSKFHKVEYSGVEGTVTDVEGDPVESSTLIGNTDSAQTDRHGFYSLYAPIGTATDLLGLKQTKVKSFTAPNSAKATVDWQHSGILVRVQTPQYEPVPGAPVEIDGESYETDANGEVLYPVSGLDVDHLVRVFENDDFTDTVTSPATEGQTTVVRVGTEGSDFGSAPEGSGPYSLSFKVIDSSTNRPARNISVTELDHDINVSTTSQGETSLVIPTDEDGEANLLLADGSKRYRAERITPTLVSGETVHITVRLTPRKHMTQV